MLLAGGKLAGITLCLVRNTEVLEKLAHFIADIGVLKLSDSQPKGDVFKQREVREENVVLEDQDYGIPVGWFFVKEDFAPIRTLNSGYEF